jgi:hypothetical protein
LGKPVFWFPVVGSTYARDNIAYRTLIRWKQECWFRDWKNYWLLQEIEGYDLCDIYNALGTVYFSIYNLWKLTFQRDFDMVVQFNSIYCWSHIASKIVKRLPTKYETNTNSQMTTKIFEDYLMKLDRELGAKNRKSCISLVSKLHIQPKNKNIFQQHQSSVSPS